MLYIILPSFGCCTLQLMVEICSFNVFHTKKLKIAKELGQNLAKKNSFLVCTQMLVEGYLAHLSRYCNIHWYAVHICISKTFQAGFEHGT